MFSCLQSYLTQLLFLLKTICSGVSCIANPASIQRNSCISMQPRKAEPSGPAQRHDTYMITLTGADRTRQRRRRRLYSKRRTVWYWTGSRKLGIFSDLRNKKEGLGTKVPKDPYFEWNIKANLWANNMYVQMFWNHWKFIVQNMILIMLRLRNLYTNIWQA